MTEIILIVAASRNNSIGNNGSVPWYISEDLKRFKKLTLGHPVIMGRKTYASIIDRLGKPLQGRQNIVLTTRFSRVSRIAGNVTVCNTLEGAITSASQRDDIVYVIGGERVYQECLPLATRIELTRVREKYEGDARLPKIDFSQWRRVNVDRRAGYSFITYEKRQIKA